MSQQQSQDLILQSIEQEDDSSIFDLLSNYADTYGTDIFFYLATTDALLKYGMYTDVFSWVEEAENVFGENSFFMERKADAFYGLADYEMALNHYSLCDVYDDDQGNLHVHHMIGLCNLRLGDYSNAIQWFENVLLETKRDDTLVLCAIAYALVGKEQRSLEYLLKVSHDLDTNWNQVVFDFLTNTHISNDFVTSFIENNHHLDTSISYSIFIKHYLYTNQLELALKKALEFNKLAFDFESHALLALVYRTMNKSFELQKVLRWIVKSDVHSDDITCSLSLQLKSLDELNYGKVTLKKYVLKYYEHNHSSFPCLSLLLSFCLNHNLFDLIEFMLLNIDFSLSEDDKEFLRNYKIQYYMLSQQYELGFSYLMNLDDIEKDGNYYKDLVVFSYYLNDYDSVMKFAPLAMPSGIVATMYHISALMINDFEIADSIIDQMTKSELSTDDIDDFSVFMDYLNNANIFFSNQEQDL